MDEVQSPISSAPPALRLITTSSAQVISLDDRRKTDLIESIEAMLKSARRGEMEGLIYIARMRNSDQHAAAVGSYVEDPRPGLIKAVECLVYAQSEHEKK